MDKEKDSNQSFYKGQNLPQKQKEDSPIDFFQKDHGFVFVYKKTEKLATAIYMVTNLFGDSEPMKWTLRTKIAQLLSFVIGFKDILQSREDEFINEIKTRVLEVVSLLEIASRSGIVSPMNFSVLKSEFVYLLNFLSQFKKVESQRSPFDLKDGFFDVPSGMTERMKRSDLQGADHDEYKNVPDIPKKTNRQNIIIDLLKKKKELTINDIAETITDCSEKTIQRELISLISIGVVQKTGERRWSRYSLVNQ